MSAAQLTCGGCGAEYDEMPLVAGVPTCEACITGTHPVEDDHRADALRYAMDPNGPVVDAPSKVRTIAQLAVAMGAAVCAGVALAYRWPLWFALFALISASFAVACSIEVRRFER